MKNKKNSSEIKTTLLSIAILASIVRAMLFHNAGESFKFMLGVCILIGVCTILDNLLERSHNKREYYDRRMRLMQQYYERMIEIEKNDLKRIHEQHKEENAL